jgi:UDP-N-acetylglucosamine pyrophosphorylase
MVSQDGKVLMEEPNKIILHPNGSGSLFDCINSYQNVRNIINSVDYVQVINVDNPLAKVMDPCMIGFTAKNDLYLGLKAGDRRMRYFSD